MAHQRLGYRVKGDHNRATFPILQQKDVESREESKRIANPTKEWSPQSLKEGGKGGKGGRERTG